MQSHFLKLIRNFLNVSVQILSRFPSLNERLERVYVRLVVASLTFVSLLIFLPAYLTFQPIRKLESARAVYRRHEVNYMCRVITVLHLHEKSGNLVWKPNGSPTSTVPLEVVWVKQKTGKFCFA